MKNKQSKLTLGVFTILVCGFVLTSYLSYSTTKNFILGSAETETLPLISDNIYSEIKKDLVDPINVSSLMANDAFLISWIASGEDELSAIQEYLGLIKKKYGYTSTFFVSEKTHNYYYSGGILKTISESDSHDVWYYDFIRMNKTVDLDIDNDEAKNGLMTVFINHRLEKEDGELLGVAGVGLQLTEIAEHIRHYEDLYHHKIYIVDQAGLIQIDSDRNRIETENITELIGIKEVSAEILSAGEEAKIVEYKDRNGLKTASARYIPEFGWYLIVEKDQESSLSGARRSMVRNFIVGGIIAVVISLLINGVMKRYNQRLEQQATSDDLTQLLNRRAFMDNLAREVSALNRYGYSSAIMMIDIDDFKSINDQFGHIAGDTLLVEIVNVIKETLRTSDLMGRWGGDEFIVYLSQLDREKTLLIAKRICEKVEQHEFSLGNLALNRTVSIGIAFLDSMVENVDDEICKADDALVNGKKLGKNRIEIAE
jgi:diguanylate cyclase (GGDEF)-like protein